MNNKFPIVFDVETQYSFEEVGGRDQFDKLKVSVVGVYNYADNQYAAFEESQMDEFEKMYRNASLIIGFNINAFDLPVIAPYFKGSFSDIPVLDLIKDIEIVLNRRVGLDALGMGTLGQGKSGHGLEALQWFRNGEVEKVKKYCLDDVRLTKDLYEYGKKYEQVFAKSKDGYTQAIPVRWGKEAGYLETLRTRLENAWKKSQVVEIDYVSSSASGGEQHRKTRRIEIRHIRNNEIEAFCRLRQDVRKFYVTRILNANPIEEFFGADITRQGSLL